MTNYILIENLGEIESNSFELIGASTKRGDTTKAGFFGSGLKYSIAFMMRSGIDFKVYSGLTELCFTTTEEILKDKTFDRICINGKPTSYTTTMGPTWTQEWFVLREILCNAMDEGNYRLILSTENVNPVEGKTRIFIQQTETLKQVAENWSCYFSEDRTPLFTTADVYTCTLANEGNVTTQPVTVYPKTSGVVYRKGVKVGEEKYLMYDYGFNHVDINEDRTAKSLGGLHYLFASMFDLFVNEAWIKNVLRSWNDEKSTTEYDSINWYHVHPVSPEWVNFSMKNLLVVKEICGKYEDQIQKYKDGEVFYIPQGYCKFLKTKIDEIRILGMGQTVGNHNFEEIEMTPKMTYLLKTVKAALLEMKYEVNYPIAVGNFDNEYVMGQADIKGKRILIADSTFDKGQREIALVLMEENEHLRSKKDDETRGFQNHIFGEWLKTMENYYGLFL